MWQCDGQRTDWCTDKTVLIIIIIPIAAVSNIICQLSLIEMFCVVSVWNERSIALQANLLPRVAGMLPQRDTDGMSTAAPIDVEDSSSDDDSWIFWLHRKSHLQIHFALRTTHCTLHTPHFTLHTALFALHASLHTALLRLHTSHFTLHSPHFTLLTSHCFLHTPNFTLHTSHCTLHAPHFTLHSSHSTLHLIWALLTLSQLISSHLISSHMSSKLSWITSQYYY